MDWDNLLADSQETEILKLGTIGNVEWKLYANGLLTFFGEGPIIDFLYEETTYDHSHDGFNTTYYQYWYNRYELGVDAPVKYVYIGEGITEIGDRAFERCDIMYVHIPNTVRKIGAYAFCNSKLSSIELPDSIEIIGDRCFKQSDNLKSVYIPARVKELGIIGDKGKSITEIEVDENNTNYTMVEGILYTADMKQLLWCSPTVAGTIHIPNSVRRVESYAFDRCTLLEEIVFSDTPVSLGCACFSRTTLRKLFLPCEVEINHRIFGYVYHKRPFSCLYAPVETDNLVVYIDEDCTARKYLAEQHIPVRVRRINGQEIC